MFERLSAEFISFQIIHSSLDCQVGAASREHPQIGILPQALSVRCILVANDHRMVIVKRAYDKQRCTEDRLRRRYTGEQTLTQILQLHE